MRQTCKACGLQDYWNFDVPDAVWVAVVPTSMQNRVVCLACFDRFAQTREVKYAATIQHLHFAGEMAALELQVTSASDGPYHF